MTDAHESQPGGDQPPDPAAPEQPPAAPEPAPGPAPATAPAPAPADRESQIVATLKQWRARRIAEGAHGAELIRDVTLKNLVKYGDTAAEQIGKKLPGAAADLRYEIAAVIAQFVDPTAGPATQTMDAARAQSRRPSITTRPLARDRPTRPAAPRPDPAEGVLLNLTHRDFCEYDYGESDVEPGPITIKSTQSGLRLSFEPFIPEAGKMVIYRVVSGDEAAPPFKPEAGDLVAVTTALQVNDDRYLTCAVRHYQVWCHVGVDHEDARHNQPFLIAEGQEVSPVDDFVVSEDEGRVIGLWTTYPGTQRVRIYRIPLEGSAPVRDDPRNQICVGQTNLTGFVDNGATRGMRYLYRVLAEVKVGSATRLSRHRQQDILVSVVLDSVDDLEVALNEDNSRFDLTWTTPPAGQVRVYRVSTPPPPGLTGSEMPEAALQVQGFTDEALIKDPIIAADANRSRIVGVPWPAAWERAYLTPVTVLGGNSRIGTTKVHTRPLPPVSAASIIERFDTEIITFGWPKGASAVHAFVGSTTLRPEEICERGHPTAEVSRAQYERDGALILPRPLEPKGCTVCLVPVSYSGGEQIRGDMTVLRYPGLHRLFYDLVPRQVPARHVREIKLYSNLDIDSPIAFVMRNRLDRFPLTPDDGELIYFRPREGGSPVSQWVVSNLARGEHMTGCKVDWTDYRGYFRLFIRSQSDPEKRYALADASPHRLWLAPSVGAPE